jgi:hypothetical protein
MGKTHVVMWTPPNSPEPVTKGRNNSTELKWVTMGDHRKAKIEIHNVDALMSYAQLFFLNNPTITTQLTCE